MKRLLLRKGFTLLELLVVITIIAVLIALALPNYLGMRQRAKDVRKKAEAGELRNALRLYYNDYALYPPDTGGPLYNNLFGCGVPSGSPSIPRTACPCSASPQVDFAVGAGCATVYMKRFPRDLGSCSTCGMYYWNVAGGDDFCIKVPLENLGDADIQASQARCSVACAGHLNTNDYALCAE